MAKSYPGDGAGAIIGEALFQDYAEADTPPNAGMGVWLLRAAWDVANPPHLSVEASVAKHRRAWRKVLGLDNPPPFEGELPGLVVDGQFFRLDDGTPHTVIGCSDFALFAKFARGEDIAQIVAERRELGFNLLRVFLSMSGGLGTFDPRPHLDALPEFCALIGGSGLRLELTVFADTKRWLPNESDQRRLLHDVDERVPLEHLIEAVNEFNIKDNAATGILNERLQDGRIWCLGSMGSDQWTAKPVKSYATYHPARDGQWPRKVGHNAYEVAAAEHVPCVSNETKRPDEDGYHAQNFWDAAANGALMCAGATWHPTSGKSSTLFTDAERPCGEAWVAGANAVPLRYQRGRYTAGHLSDSVVEFRPGMASHTRILGNTACLSVPQNPDGWVPKNGWRIVNQHGSVIELEK